MTKDNEENSNNVIPFPDKDEQNLPELTDEEISAIIGGENLDKAMEAAQVIDLKTRQVLDSLQKYHEIEQKHVCKKLLHQIEMLEPVEMLIVGWDSRGSKHLFVTSTKQTAEGVIFLLEQAKRKVLQATE